jgi:PAS domain S-box-containing protein
MTQTTARHVLVVDDTPEDRAELRSQLLNGSTQRWRFTEAATGATALQAIQDAGPVPFDCVLLDYHLPDMDAPELLALLCDATSQTPCPVLVVTGSTAHDGNGLVRAGAQDFIGKAWTTAQSLARAVDNAIERFAMQRESLRGRQALAVERERLAMALTAGQMGVFELNLADGSLTWSPEVYALFGVDPAHFVPTRASFRMLVHPEDRCIPWQSLNLACAHGADHAPCAAAHLQAVADPGALPQPHPTPATCEYRIQRPDGQLRWVAQRGQTGHDASSGQPHHHGVVFDITERKRAESAQAQSSQRLQDQQFYTRSLIDSNTDGLLVTDPSGTVTDANRQMETLTGCTRAELIGSNFTGLFSEPQRARGSLNLTLANLLLLDYELELLPRDGQGAVVSLNASTFHDRQRTLQGVIFSMRDVTQRHFLSRALQETNASLEEARSTAVRDHLTASDRLRVNNQEMLRQLQSVLHAISRLERDTPALAPTQTATLAHILKDSRVLLNRVQSDIGPQAAA